MTGSEKMIGNTYASKEHQGLFKDWRQKPWGVFTPEEIERWLQFSAIEKEGKK